MAARAPLGRRKHAPIGGAVSRKFEFRLEWRCLTVGLILPHGGMVVWTLCLGPLRVEFWPLATEPEAF